MKKILAKIYIGFFLFWVEASIVYAFFVLKDPYAGGLFFIQFFFVSIYCLTVVQE